VSSQLFRGFILGFAVAAAPGPIFFLCLRRTLLRGRLYGFVSGLGVATADAIYAAIASLGVVALETAIAGGRRPLELVGGAVLILLGARIALERQTSIERPVATRTGLALAYLSTLGLTITNPATVISFAALAATLGLGAGVGFVKPAGLVGGVFVGSAAWWCLVAVAASSLRERLTSVVIRAISTMSGVVIAVLGMLAIYAALS
jgi:threonine/homoserine/homoserine lactone efflux protein